MSKRDCQCGVRFSLGWLINLQSRSAREERGGGGTKRGFSGAQGPARDQDPRDGEGERVTKGGYKLFARLIF